MAKTGDIIVVEGEEYIYLNDTNYYKIVDGVYHLVATFGLAASLTGIDPIDLSNKLLTKGYVTETYCKIKDNPILDYTNNNQCVLFEDLEPDLSIPLPGIEGEVEDSGYGDNYFKLFYKTTDNSSITPSVQGWYVNTGQTGDVFYIYPIQTNIPNDTFFENTKIKSLVLDCETEVIGERCFSGCDNLSSVMIYGKFYVSSAMTPSVSLSDNAFSNCSNLKTVVFGSYWYDSLKKVNLESEVFNNCAKLFYLQGQDNISEIYSSAFRNCTSLKVITPINCTSFGKSAFSGCTNLEKVIINSSAFFSNDSHFDNTQPYPDDIFYGCTSIREIIFLGDVHQITGFVQLMRSISDNNNGDIIVRVPRTYLANYQTEWIDYSGKTWFANLSANTYVNENEIILATTAEYTYQGSDDTNPSQRGLIETAIARGWLRYNTRTFTIYDAQEVLRVNMSNTNDIINDKMFGVGGHGNPLYNRFEIGQCKEDTINDFDSFKYFTSVKEMPVGAFMNCERLSVITIPTSITALSDYAFFECQELSSVTIPDSVTSIGQEAFYKCSSLTNINYQSTISDWNNITLGTDWNLYAPITVIHCTDGDISLIIP